MIIVWPLRSPNSRSCLETDLLLGGCFEVGIPNVGSVYFQVVQFGKEDDDTQISHGDYSRVYALNGWWS